MQNGAEQQMVKVPVTVTSSAGRLRATLPVPAGETNLTGLLPILREFTSSLVQQVIVSMEHHGRPVTCGPHCTACCSQLVPISPFEAESLANWIRTLLPEQQQALAARFHAALLRLQDNGVLARLSPEMFEMETAAFRELGRDYFVANVACPFLLDGLCGIHPIRPLVCREYMVVTPPAYCAEPGHMRAEGVVLPMRPSQAVIRLGRQVEGDRQGWLPLIFLFHWMAARSGAGEWVSGTGPAVLSQFLEALAQQPGVSVATDS